MVATIDLLISLVGKLVGLNRCMGHKVFPDAALGHFPRIRSLSHQVSLVCSYITPLTTSAALVNSIKYGCCYREVSVILQL